MEYNEVNSRTELDENPNDNNIKNLEGNRVDSDNNFDLENVVDLLEAEPTEGLGYPKEIDAAIETDENGVQWITIRAAEKISGFCYSTISRYTKSKKIASKKERMATGGMITYVKLEEIEHLRDEKELTQTEREVKAFDYQINMTKVLQNAIQPSMREINGYLEKVESYQIQLITNVRDNENFTKKAINELSTTVCELQEIIKQQSEKIDQQAALIEKLQEKPKKRGLLALLTRKD